MSHIIGSTDTEVSSVLNKEGGGKQIKLWETENERNPNETLELMKEQKIYPKNMFGQIEANVKALDKYRALKKRLQEKLDKKKQSQ